MRQWFVSPVRWYPGLYVPGKWNNLYWEGPAPYKIDKLRGPFDNAHAAAEAAGAWRAEDIDKGRRSLRPLWLLLVEKTEIAHCNKFQG